MPNVEPVLLGACLTPNKYKESNIMAFKEPPNTAIRGPQNTPNKCRHSNISIPEALRTPPTNAVILISQYQRPSEGWELVLHPTI
jgi:hypothetical protein